MLVTDPAGVTTVNFAVVEVASVSGKVKVTARDVAVPPDLIVTPDTPVRVTEVAPNKLLPVIVTVLTVVAFLVPLLGVKLVIVGAGSTTAKLALGDIPAGVVTVIVPLVAPVGTFTVRLVRVAVVAGVALTPPKFTLVAPNRLVPVIVIVAPTAALAGAVMAPAGK